MIPPALLDVEGVRTGVDTLIREHVAHVATELAAAGTDTRLAGALATMTSGGKRLRAAFCYWSWRAHGGDLAEPSPGIATRTDVLRIGASLELFQAAALFHDDVFDDSDTRRGLPSAHRHFADVHTSQRWFGPANRFGESVAILLGDLALIAAERVFTQAVCDLAPTARHAACDIFGCMRTEVMAGQYLDLLAQAEPVCADLDRAEDRARAIVRAKSARYSVEHPLSLGARVAGADDDALAQVHEIGLALGEAFQLRDDLLGVFGDPNTTGKPAGDDLREGKRTVLVAKALRRAAPADRERLTAGLGRRDLTDDEVAGLRDVICRTGARAEVEDLITTLGEPALAALEAAPLTEPGRAMLVCLGRAAVDRPA